MEIVTGDRYLDLLARFAEDKVGALLEGSVVLKLNPLGLHYLQARLDSLHELERLRTAAPVDYLRAYIADLGDHRALELLRRVLQLLSSVKVVSSAAQAMRDPTPVTLLPFGRLTTLELRGCDLSTSAARGLLQLRPHLKTLICHNSTDALRHVFAERMVEVHDSQVWSRLTTVSCACNGILVMDESLQLLPVVEVLDLKRNRLTHASNLRKCTRLKFLDLSFNSIQSVAMLDEVSSCLTTLILRFNALTSTKGIDKLYRLEHLDLSDNIISNFAELENFGRLCFLSTLTLEGNPLTFVSGYRERALSALANPYKVCLDGKAMSRLESWLIHKLLVKKSKKDGGFGLYAPAVKHPEDVTQEDNVDHKGAKKKGSRLAVIEDDEEERIRLDHSQSHDIGDVEATKSKLQQLLRRVKNDKWPMKESAETSSPGRQKNVRRRRLGSSSSQKLEKTTLDVEEHKKPLESIAIFPVEVPGPSSSTSSPPHFNTEVLQRRQNLEEAMLQLGDCLASSGSDSSTSSSEKGSGYQLLAEADKLEQSQLPGTSGAASSSLLVEDSCFFDPMWVGSAVLGPKTQQEQEQEQEQQQQPEQKQTSRASNGSLVVVKEPKSRQAWRVAPSAHED